MNRQSLTDDAIPSMLRAVSQVVGMLSEEDLASGFSSEDNAPLLQLMGIRAGATQAARVTPTNISLWRDIVSQTGIEALQKQFSQSRVIPFSDWTDVQRAADLWYGLLADVIRPLARNDWEFIFYLGNPVSRHFFDVDEILDVMGSFAHSGNVTLALDEREAWGVWSVLFGGKDVPEFGMEDPDAKGRYRTLFQTLDVRRLIVYSQTNASLIMEDSYFEVTRPPVPAHMHHGHERDKFIEGYASGLKIGMEPSHCLLLGIATAGSIAGAEPAKAAVERFLAGWANGI